MNASSTSSSFEFNAKNCSRRMSVSESKAPASTRLSMFFLLQALRLTRSKKSKLFLNLPFVSRSLISASTAPAPTFFIPASPKRILPSLFTVNVRSLSLISGPSTFIFNDLHSSISLPTSVMSSLFLVKLAAMNSAS